MINCSKCNEEIVPNIHNSENNIKTVFKITKTLLNNDVLEIRFLRCGNCNERYFIDATNNSIRDNIEEIKKIKENNKKLGSDLAKGKITDKIYRKSIKKNSIKAKKYVDQNLIEMELLKEKHESSIHKYPIK